MRPYRVLDLLTNVPPSAIAMSVEGALVCGFSDEASQVAGVAWSIEGATAPCSRAAATPARRTAEIERADAGARFSAELGDAR